MVKKKGVWLGMLEAGKRSSPVVRDDSLDTGNPATVYLFNLTKARILEYRREIVEPKLRELTEKESSIRKELYDAFESSRDGFLPRAALRPARTSSRTKKRPVEPELPALEDEAEWSPAADDDDDDVPEEFEAEGAEDAGD
jgi:hypothetical protein